MTSVVFPVLDVVPVSKHVLGSVVSVLWELFRCFGVLGAGLFAKKRDGQCLRRGGGRKLFAEAASAKYDHNSYIAHSDQLRRRISISFIKDVIDMKTY